MSRILVGDISGSTYWGNLARGNEILNRLTGQFSRALGVTSIRVTSLRTAAAKGMLLPNSPSSK